MLASNNKINAVKKAAQRTEGENERNEVVTRMPLAYYVIIIVIVLFGINVGYETYEDMDNKFSVTGSQSKTCMIDFQKSNCNLSTSPNHARRFWTACRRTIVSLGR